MKRSNQLFPAGAARTRVPMFPSVLLALSLGAGWGGCFEPSRFHNDGGVDMASTGGSRTGTGGSGGNAGDTGAGTGGSVIDGTGGAPTGSGSGGMSTGSGGIAGSGGAPPPGTGGAGGTAGTGAGGSGSGGRGGIGGTGSGGRGGTGGGAGGSGGMSGGTGGAGGQVCTPVAEQCNGRDDDCDRMIDEDCPIDQQPLGTRTVSSTSQVFGTLTAMRNTKFTDVCPDGQAIIGFRGDSNRSLDSVGVRCGTLRVREDRTTIPFTYRVMVTQGIEFDPVGGDGGTRNTLDSGTMCGPDQVLVAVTMTTEPEGQPCPHNGCAVDDKFAGGCLTMYGIAVTCVGYNIVGSPGSFKLVRSGTPFMGSRVGSGGREMRDGVESSFSCSATGAIRQIQGAYGPWPSTCSVTVVNGLQFSCTEPTIPVR